MLKIFAKLLQKDSGHNAKTPSTWYDIKAPTGSAETVILINHFGHCASYSRLLELETAMGKSIDVKRKSVIPSTVHPDRNIITHLCWVHFDMREGTPSDSRTTHTTRGIIIQEASMDTDGTSSDILPLPRTKDRSLHMQTKGN